MKPIVIYVKENGEVKLTREELDKMLEEAYQSGYSDGSKTSSITYPYYPYYEKTVPNWWYKVTCAPNVGTTTTTTTECKCGGEHHCTCHSDE